jgi:hypothetical protein
MPAMIASLAAEAFFGIQVHLFASGIQRVVSAGSMLFLHPSPDGRCMMMDDN